MPYLRFSSISKYFLGVEALKNISFEVAEGCVHGLLGENGAGKSTLLKILGGQYLADKGSLYINGEEKHFRNTRDSIAAGIALIPQDLWYLPDMSVADNLLLGKYLTWCGFVRQQAMFERVSTELQSLGVFVPPDIPVRHLSVGQRQMIEICKALMRDAKIIALDEPTSSLSHRESETLFRLVQELKKKKKVVIYISHRLNEIYDLCDECTILRDGQKVASYASLTSVPRTELVRQMVGREISNIYGYQPRPLGENRLEVRGVHSRLLPHPISFNVRRGEIVGFFGLVGAGRSQLLRLLYGVERLRSGQILLAGQAVTIRHVRDSIRHGLAFCPEDRQEEGIIGGLSVAENINISWRQTRSKWNKFLNTRQEAEMAEKFIERLKIKTPHRHQEMRFLSGGNQQKAILSRWLAEQRVQIIMVDEPTRGIDVGAKAEIYAVMYELAQRGCSILMVSSELPEVLNVSDRIIVMRDRQIVGEMSRSDATEHNVLELALSAHIAA